MGDRVEVENIPLHMSGVGIYQNPVYNLAGEAYRASDVAWDMASKDQIVPNAHFTQLIEHAWRHPSFTNLSELTTQIRPEAVLFHASKDGSLINLLKMQRGSTIGSVSISDLQRSSIPMAVQNMHKQEQGGVQTTNQKMAEGSKMGSAQISKKNDRMGSQVWEDQEAAELRAVREKYAAARASSGLQQEAGSDLAVPTVSSTGTQNVMEVTGERYSTNQTVSGVRPAPDPPVDRGDPVAATPIYDIFIRTYPADYPWLDFCLVSIAKYTTGFRKIWIVSPEEPGLLRTTHEKHLNIEWKKMNEESPDGYLSQQIHKLYADVITDYEPDYILHIDSDTLFTRPVTPQHFFTQPTGSLDVSKQKLIWYYTPYEQT